MAFILDPTAAPASAPAPAGSNGEVVKNTDTARFMADVIEASMKVPVIVDFWAPWCGPCKQLGPLIEKLVRQAGGMVRLVKINVDENQELAAQMRVQSIPAVYAFKGGRPVDGFVGALPESQIRAFIDRLKGGAKAPLEQALDQAKAALDASQPEAARAVYEQVLAHDPGHAAALGGLIRCLVAVGRTPEARQLLEGLSASLRAAAEVAAAAAALELVEQGDGGDVAALKERLARDANDHQARFDLAVAHYAAGRAEAAIDELLDLVRRARAWNEEAARKQLVKIFDALGQTHPLTVASRRRLSSLLFS